MNNIIFNAVDFSDKLVIASEDTNEVCGLMIGNDNVVAKTVMVRNIEPSPTYFKFSIEDYKRVAEDAINNDQNVLGIFHSHPLNVPHPSSTDLIYMNEDTSKIWTIYSCKYKNWASWKIEDGELVPIATSINYQVK